MTAGKTNLAMRLGAVTLALVTLTAVIFGILNFQQRSHFVLPDDGVAWLDNPNGVVAWHVMPDSPAARAGIRAGDQLKAINGTEIHRATQVAQRLARAGVWMEVRYRVARDGGEFELPLITAPMPRPASAEGYLRVVGVLYLVIGLFIFARRWSAPRALHFYVFCLVSFIFYNFHYSGKLSTFDLEVYWANVVAWLLQPAMLVHFALVFPERHSRRGAKLFSALVAVYAVPALLLLVHVSAAMNVLGFIPSPGARLTLDRIELGYLVSYFLLAAVIFLWSYRRAPSGIVRQQLKWATGGTLASILPFFLLYIIPFVAGVAPRTWMNLSVISLALLPLCFGYAIIRYRLMDVDIIFKRGLAYTVATAGIVAIYFAVVGVVGELFHTAWTTGPGGAVLAIVAAAFFFQPLRDWVQTRLDHFFYRDRLDYRRTLIEFGRTLTSPPAVGLEPMLASALHRISQALLIDRLAIFLEDAERPGSFRVGRSMGLDALPSLDLSFLNAESLAAQGYLFFDSLHAASEVGESAKRSLEELDLNYFIACRHHERIVAVLGLGKTVDGDFLSTDDLDLLFTMAGYIAIAVENARLYQSLQQKASQIERLKDFSENIVESLRVGVLAVDHEGRIESWNPPLEQCFGVSREQALGRELEEILPPELMAEIAARMEDEHVSTIYKFRLPPQQSGALLVINVAVAPLVGKSGERLGRLILVDDITQRVSLEEQLVQADKLTSMGLLAAGVAHEVNTPLAVISNYIQILAKQMPAGDPRQGLIEKIVKQTFRASEIVNHLLNFSRTGAGGFTEVNLNSVVEETLSLVAHPFNNGGVRVIKSLAANLPPILGASNRLQQVFLNMFINARDAMPNGGMLEVRTNAVNGSVEVEVTDTGVGIPPEHLQRIFDPFFTTKSSSRGTGLGLSVSYGIIREHAGKVEVHSTPGKGTSFRLEFPAARKMVHA